MARYSILKNFYTSSRWIKFRLLLINQRGNKCERCGEMIPRSIDIIGHHKTELTPENVNDYNISLNPNNVELICFDCHNQIHNRFGYKVAKKVYLVYGSPMSGKKTFVKHNVIRGDIVVDMDRLYEAVSMLPSYDKPDNLFSNVIGVHNLLLDNIKTRLGKWNTAYVIGGYADKFKRERLVDELGAELVYCESSKEECYARLETDKDRQYRITEWKKYIDSWFEKYS